MSIIDVVVHIQLVNAQTIQHGFMNAYYLSIQQRFGQSAVRHPAGTTIPPRPLASKLKINRRRFTLQQHELIWDAVSVLECCKHT